MAAAPEDGDHVVVVADRAEVDDERRMPEATEGGRGQERAVEAVRLAIPQDAARAAVDGLVAVGQRVEQPLDRDGPVEGVELAPLVRRPVLARGGALTQETTSRAPNRPTLTSVMPRCAPGCVACCAASRPEA